MDVTVVVGTFGDHAWLDLALERAIPSAKALGLEVIAAHLDTLHEARNFGLACAETEWVCFLDADDELEPGYIDHMARGSCDLRAPSVRYVDDRTAFRPKVPRVAGHGHDCTAPCLPFGNYLVIGSLVRAEMVRDVGGFRDWPCYEDWDLWLRCYRSGADVETIPEAVYRAHVRGNSRNRGQTRDVKESTHRAIVEAVEFEYGSRA